MILWDVATGAPIKKLEDNPSIVMSVAFSPDGNTLAASGGSPTVPLWRADSAGTLAKATYLTLH